MYATIKQNNRSPDFTDCSFTSRVIWEIGGNTFSNAPCDAGLYYTNQSDTNICKTFSKNGHNHQEIVFNARGPSAGLVESSIGSIFTIVFSEVQGTLRVKVECWGRENNWIDLERRPSTLSLEPSHGKSLISPGLKRV